MQAVKIINAIIGEKRQRRIVPAIATEFEVFTRYHGTRRSLTAELNAAVSDNLIREVRTLNWRAFEVPQKENEA